MIQTATPATIQTPKRSSQRLTVKIGPASANPVQTIATTRIHSEGSSNPNRSIDTAFATLPIAQNSNAVHPTSWIRFAADGR